jgi:hypothetical protein
MIEIRCGRCERAGRLQIARLLAEFGQSAPMGAVLRAKIGDCPRRDDQNISSRCDPYCPAPIQQAGARFRRQLDLIVANQRLRNNSLSDLAIFALLRPTRSRNRWRPPVARQDRSKDIHGFGARGAPPPSGGRRCRGEARRIKARAGREFSRRASSRPLPARRCPPSLPRQGPCGRRRLADP